ncbi:MAG: substrate-binding domain-containing protein [Verrucomicrobiales bacterium]|nr:substrate-binding domain-containing protein [Verrucomicrobiales bacterium]
MIPDESLAPILPSRCSLVAETVQSLLDGIRRGIWKQVLPGERELSEQLQVSRRTLRVALADVQRMGWLSVSARQRRRITMPSEEGEGSPNSKVVAVLCSDSFSEATALTTLVMDVLRDKLAKAGCVVEFHSRRDCFSSRPGKALGRLVEERPALAWLLLGSNKAMQAWFADHHVPCLVVGSCTSGIDLPSVDVDYRAACRHAGGVLWRAGHRRMAMVQLADAQAGDLEGEEGWMEVLQDLPEAEVQVLRHDGSAQHLCALLDEAMAVRDAPTAYLVARSQHALTVMMHLQLRGKSVPDEVAVISRDDAYFLEATRPVVARYATDPAGLARRVAMAARRLVENGTLPVKGVRLMPKFLVGETVGGD